VLAYMIVGFIVAMPYSRKIRRPIRPMM